MNTVEKYESKFITSKDYKKHKTDLLVKFYEYRDKYVPKSIMIERAENDYAKILKYCEKKSAKICEILQVFRQYWESIPVSAMQDWMSANHAQKLIATKSYYDARKYAKIFRKW